MRNSSKILALTAFSVFVAVWNFANYAVAGWLISLFCGAAMVGLVAWQLTVYRHTRRFEAGRRYYVTQEGEAQ